MTRSEKVENPGPYSFVPDASLITAGGRLLLAMAERLVRDAGSCHAMMDTDSILVIANESGGLFPCESGPERFRKEDVNISANGKQVELRYFGIASKRYVGFRGDPRNPQIIKPSQHGVGCYFKPDKRKWVKPRDCANEEKYPALAFDDWEHILKQQFSDYAVHTDEHHPFLNHLAMRKVRVNTPRELAALRKLDPDKARLFNFCISPVL